MVRSVLQKTKDIMYGPVIGTLAGKPIYDHIVLRGTHLVFDGALQINRDGSIPVSQLSQGCCLLNGQIYVPCVEAS